MNPEFSWENQVTRDVVSAATKSVEELRKRASLEKMGYYKLVNDAKIYLAASLASIGTAAAGLKLYHPDAPALYLLYALAGLGAVGTLLGLYSLVEARKIRKRARYHTVEISPNQTSGLTQNYAQPSGKTQRARIVDDS